MLRSVVLTNRVVEMERRFNSLKTLREYHRMSLNDVGEKLGVTPATIWQWEQKPNSWLKPKHLLQLQRAFSPEDIAEAFDPDWTPPEPEPEQPTREPICQTAFSDSELEHMIRELMCVFTELNDDRKTALVDYADYLYHQQTGMKLPRITQSVREVPDDVWDEIEKIRQTPVMP